MNERRAGEARRLLLRLCASLCACLMLLPLAGCEREAEGVLVPQPLTVMERDYIPSGGATTLPEPAPVMRIENKNDTFERGVITVNNSDYQIPAALLDTLYGTMRSYPFATAFYALDLDSGMSFGYNADIPYTPACTIKAGYALSCFKRIEAGEKSLDDVFTYQSGRHWFFGSGTIQYKGNGAQISLREILFHLINESDNTAYMMLWDIFAGLSAGQQSGDAYYSKMMEDLGCEPWYDQYGKWSRMRALDLGLVWQEIYRYYKTGSAEAAYFWELLTTNQYCEIEKVVTDVPVIAHKSGWDVDGYHEAGLVMREHPYIVVVMTVTGDENSCLHNTIKNIDTVMLDYAAWLDGSEAGEAPTTGTAEPEIKK